MSEEYVRKYSQVVLPLSRKRLTSASILIEMNLKFIEKIEKNLPIRAGKEIKNKDYYSFFKKEVIKEQ